LSLSWGRSTFSQVYLTFVLRNRAQTVEGLRMKVSPRFCLSVLTTCLVCLLCPPLCQSKEDGLETVSDEELQKLIAQENHVIALFSEFSSFFFTFLWPPAGLHLASKILAHEDQDKKCREFETELASIREDLVDSINAW